MELIEVALHRLGAAFVAGLHEPGYLLISASEWGRSAQSYTMAGSPGLLGRWPTTDLNEAMAAFHAGTVIEVIGDPGGDYTIHWTRVSGSTPTQVLLDAGYRFPGHERPSPRTPGVTDRRPTDPQVLAEVRELVAEFVREHHAEGYPAGNTEEEILAAEDRLGVRLPEDLRALYRVLPDDRTESGLLDPFVLAPLDRLVEWNAEFHPGYQDGVFEDPMIFDCDPPGHVRRVSSSSGWLTFARDYGMNFAAVDLDPGPLGTHGQVVTHGRDVWAPVEYVAGSVRALLRRAIDTLDEERDDPPPERWQADSLTEVEDPAVVQEIVLADATDVRFADLDRFPNLKSIVVRDSPTPVDMTLPPALPIERVNVTAPTFDPAVLTTAPTLSGIRLAGNKTPVPIAALATLPALLSLDLAEAEVTDIDSIAKFPALRRLTLSADQWTGLLATGWQPSSLAAAELAGPAGVAAATHWRRSLGHEATHRTLHGPRPAT